jgi:GNAT superfamily N-acetyltransferase
LKADIVPARWWQAVSFIRLYFEMVRGFDPWADRILARPWAPSSLLEYIYMIDNFFRLSNFLILVSGEQAGAISLVTRPEFIYIYGVGLLPKYQRARIGKQIVEFLESYGTRKKVHWGVAAMAVNNKPVHMLVGACGGRLLGLSTTTLTVTTAGPAPSSVELEVVPLCRPEASSAWTRWRLYEVEQVAGNDAVELAALLLESLPRGEYLGLYRRGQEIGFALAHGPRVELDIDLFPAKEFWSSASTAGLVVALARHLGANIRRLTLTQTHAKTLNASEAFGFERNREQERHLVFFKRV